MERALKTSESGNSADEDRRREKRKSCHGAPASRILRVSSELRRDSIDSESVVSIAVDESDWSVQILC